MLLELQFEYWSKVSSKICFQQQANLTPKLWQGLYDNFISIVFLALLVFSFCGQHFISCYFVTWVWPLAPGKFDGIADAPALNFAFWDSSMWKFGPFAADFSWRRAFIFSLTVWGPHFTISGWTSCCWHWPIKSKLRNLRVHFLHFDHVLKLKILSNFLNFVANFLTSGQRWPLMTTTFWNCDWTSKAKCLFNQVSRILGLFLLIWNLKIRSLSKANCANFIDNLCHV